MDQQNHFGHGTPSAPVSFEDKPYTPADHQITEHGTPDPEPKPAFSAFSGGSFESEGPAKVASEPIRPATFEPIVANEPAFVPPALSTPSLSKGGLPDDQPVPVVRVLSVRGLEYAFMSIMLWFGAASLIWILDTLIMGSASFQALSFPLSTLLTSLPVFAFLFLRLRKAELANPSLRLEPSKRRFSQITQILAFLTCFFNVVGVVYMIVASLGGGEMDSIPKSLGITAVTLLVAGGILAYYWIDEHRLVGR